MAVLSGVDRSHQPDPRAVGGLQTYQRLHMIADNGRLDLETRTTLLADSREHDFRALLRAARERVVDAKGLFEDGSALGVVGEVQGRVLDSAEFRPLPVPAAAASRDANPPSLLRDHAPPPLRERRPRSPARPI